MLDMQNAEDILQTIGKSGNSYVFNVSFSVQAGHKLPYLINLITTLVEPYSTFQPLYEGTRLSSV